ncbi:hypothetical protein KC347_g49 [Hortaea werneckii]|nr:hypothetical protein KC347_g49 [Hortaea werneckii]
MCHAHPRSQLLSRSASSSSRSRRASSSASRSRKFAASTSDAPSMPTASPSLSTSADPLLLTRYAFAYEARYGIFGFLGCSLKRSTQSWPLGLCIVVPSRKIDVSGCFRLRDFSCARRALRSCVAALNAWFEAMTKQCS